MGVTAIPYDSNGNFSLVSGYLAVSGQTILASQHNPPFEDVAAALSQVVLRSGVAGMTGNFNFNSFKGINLAAGAAPGDAVNKAQLDAVSATIPAAGVKLDTLQPYVTVASAATTDLGALASQNVTVTGTTTITSFGTVAAGTIRNVVFSGALTLTHHATSLILPFGANITTAARAAIRAVSLGSGNWRVTDYQEAAPYAPTLTAGAGLSSTGSLASGTMAIELDFYTGSNASLTDYPVGEILFVQSNGTNLARNQSSNVYIKDDDTGSFVLPGPNQGAQLSGVWRNRGQHQGSDGGLFCAMRKVG